jgi:hypothetical protein
MASLNTYLDNIQYPNVWSAAHYPIIFTAEPQTRTNVLIDNSAGYARLTFSSAFTLPLNAGALIYISDGAYKGFHLIKSVNTTIQVVLETLYTVNDNTAYDVNYCPTLNFTLYKGYETTEEFPTELPLTEVASFKVEINTKTISYRWDVSGYLKSIFTIQPPTEGIDFNMFNRWRLYFLGEDMGHYQVANASIPQSDFNEFYVNTGKILNSQNAIVFSCGKTIYSKLQNNVIVNEIVEDAESEPEFTLQFNNQFKIQI